MSIFGSQPSGPSQPAPRVDWPDAAREAAFRRWLGSTAPAHGINPDSVCAASADASFRRYLRVGASGTARSFIVMDAPPPLEDVRPFMHVGGLITAAGLPAPRVLAADAAHGFLLLDDLGDTPYLGALQAAVQRGEPAVADRLMRAALAALVRFQSGVPAASLPPCDAALLARELALFPEWCVLREFGVRWTAAQQASWQRVCDLLIDSALAQPVVAVHADWMPRNLMVLPAPANSGGAAAAPLPGILDFQDAMAGPIGYDLASLLRDAFISWDEEQELDWAVRWWQQARAAGLPVDPDFGAFWQALEWLGLQRHLKVMGIFCRLKHRDAKPHYAADLPRFFAYANKVALRYRPLQPLLALLEPLSGTKVEAAFTF